MERPAGDDARQWGPPFLEGEALWFTAMNRNKRSVVLDIEQPADRAALFSLISLADIVVTNQPPEVQRKLGLDAQSLRDERPDLIFVSITGFGLSGERAGLTCYDLIAEGHSGIMDITGAQDGPPQKIGAPAADMLAGQDAAMATMAAVVGRLRHGRGCVIDVNLVESMTRFLACRLSSYMGSGEVPRRSGGTDSVIAIYQCFETLDLPINLGLGSDAIWERFWRAVGDPDFGSSPTYRTNRDRREHREAIVERIRSVLVTRSRADWLALFAKARIPAGPINAVDEVVADQALHDRGLFFSLQGQDGRTIPQIGLGIQIDGRWSVPRSLPPLLGQHTSEVINEISASAVAANGNRSDN